jgi:hypothetical protein
MPDIPDGYKEVPPPVARDVGERFDKNVVVIICWDETSGLMHTTSWGLRAVDKVYAAQAAEIITKGLGGDLDRKIMFRDFRADHLDAGLAREAFELCQKIVARNGTTAPMIQQAERIAKAAGLATRE